MEENKLLHFTFLNCGFIFNQKIGNLLTGIFASNSIVTMAGDTSVGGGWVDGNVIFIFIYYVLFKMIQVIQI